FFTLQVLVAASHCSEDLQSCGPLGVWAKVGSATAERNPPITIAEMNLHIASSPFSSLPLDAKTVSGKNVTRSHRFPDMPCWHAVDGAPSRVRALISASQRKQGALQCCSCTSPHIF